jgi:hypothetical protein
MTHSFIGKLRMRGLSARKIWRRSRFATLALTISVTGLAACGDDGGDVGSARESTVAPSTAINVTTPAQGDRESILIKTQIRGFAGKVLAGSVIGDSPFCPGGTVRHEHGSPEIGFPAINVFRCGDGQLKIGFGPGPDQMNNRVQTSGWKILEGSGRFAGISGDGQMKVMFSDAVASNGQETFRGTVVVP